MAKERHYCARAGRSKHAKTARAVRILESKPIGGTVVELEHLTQLAKPVCDGLREKVAFAIITASSEKSSTM